MKKLLIMVLFIFCSSLFVFSESAAVMEAEKLYVQGKHKEGMDFLQKAIASTTSKNEKFELQWMLARATMEWGNIRENEGLDKKDLIEIFKTAAGYAEDAIATDPSNPKGYFWKSANLGRWGEVKGVLESLNMAKEMRALLEKSITLDPEFGLGWHVLGILYERVPGGISFGNNDFAVSLGRKSIVVHEAAVEKGIDKEINWGYYVELAKHLNKRNFSAVKRTKNQGKLEDKYRSASGNFDKSCYFEATVKLKKMSDREEARELLEWTIKELKSIKSPTFTQKSDLDDALEALKELK
jgi:tetratricopeptide (TPR) repeat protein